MSYGFKQAGFNVLAGVDIDASCKYAYETNVGKFISKDLRQVEGSELEMLFKSNGPKILIGCAPCQPFSTHTQKQDELWKKFDDRRNLLLEFGRVAIELRPDVVVMENVPLIATTSKGLLLKAFITCLERAGLNYFTYGVLDCRKYGVPQTRKRFVLLASKYGKIDLPAQTNNSSNYVTVRQVIQELPPIQAGQCSVMDPLHASCTLSPLNLKRIKASEPGKTWEIWPDELKLECHKRASGSTYKAVYGRMEWDKPGPTITTQFTGLGTGRFGHPSQDRALSLREGALLQSFPQDYQFWPLDKKVNVRVVAKHIGNAVPVKLASVIAKSVLTHLLSHHHGSALGNDDKSECFRTSRDQSLQQRASRPFRTCGELVGRERY